MIRHTYDFLFMGRERALVLMSWRTCVVHIQCVLCTVNIVRFYFIFFVSRQTMCGERNATTTTATTKSGQIDDDAQLIVGSNEAAEPILDFER